MNPFFLSSQFPELVRTDVDEGREMPVVCTGMKEEAIVNDEQVLL